MVVEGDCVRRPGLPACVHDVHVNVGTRVVLLLLLRVHRCIRASCAGESIPRAVGAAAAVLVMRVATFAAFGVACCASTTAEARKMVKDSDKPRANPAEKSYSTRKEAGGSWMRVPCHVCGWVFSTVLVVVYSRANLSVGISR
jgi:hypothetical protein